MNAPLNNATSYILSEFVVYGQHDIKFDLTQESDHATLKRFLHFVGVSCTLEVRLQVLPELSGCWLG